MTDTENRPKVEESASKNKKNGRNWIGARFPWLGGFTLQGKFSDATTSKIVEVIKWISIAAGTTFALTALSNFIRVVRGD